ncbi:alpha/beta hydrolase [Halobacillus sp. K22]|uniref:alpha/beta hydrolase n=1 Tax=Halobacillus sp. K22 TaxID=3457431 RepID=UPI003FCE1E79
MRVWLPIIMLVFLITAGCSEGNQTSKGSDKVGGDNIEGEWSGSIQVPDQPLNITVKFRNEESLEGSISIPAQNIEDYPLSQVSLNGKELAFQMSISGQSLRFIGAVEKDSISGTFTQSGKNFNFELEKQKSSSSNASKENFMTIETITGTLYGSLLLPEKDSRQPVALIIPGSGPTDRNGNSPGIQGKNNSLKLLAEELADRGVASVRYDKRGAGKNAQAVTKEGDIRFDQFVDDAKQWIDKLNQDKRFSEVIVIGHSQGSLVGMIAAEPESTDAFVSIAGAGRTFDQLLENQLAESLPDDLYQESLKILDKLRGGENVQEVSDPLMSVFKPSIQPFLQSWMAYDPAEQMKEMDIPTLIVNGTNDLQVPEKEAQILANANPEAELLLIEDMNHVLKKAPADREGNLKTYGDPDLSLAEELVPGIMEFLQQHGVK